MNSTTKCLWHLCNNTVRTTHLGVSKYCSSRCKNKYAVSLRRKKLKLLAVEYLGGKCSTCGYNKCIEALDFHHRDSSVKEFGIAAKGNTRSWESVKQELNKCILLCANCHREHHYLADAAGLEPAPPCGRHE